MLYSGNLLKRYLSLTTDPENIANQLTLKTCEIEEVIHRELPELLVIGKVTSCEKHPNADKLVVCQLDCGEKGTWQICTGGENVHVGGYVPVALVGCHLPAINLTIGEREMRGLESNGMICSKTEIGIPEDMDEHRIWMFQYDEKEDLSSVAQTPDFDDITDQDLGISLGEKRPWLENWILDVENKTITHRPDLFGHFGLSVELHTIFDKHDASFASGNKYMEQMQHSSIFEILENAAKSEKQATVNSKHVHSYMIIEANDIQVKRSDLFMRLALYDLGLQPRNNRVDFSNLFMYLTGQPIHCFDADRVSGNIEVRQATKGEKFTDLFGKEHDLIEQDVVISDSSNNVLALGGVVGGENSGVTDATTQILIEVGNFDAVTLRKTGTRLGLRTDAELRFEKNINPRYSINVLPMLLDEIKYSQRSLGEVTIGGMSRYINETNHGFHRDQIVPMSMHAAGEVIGDTSEAFTKEATEILTDLGFTLHPDGDVSVPLWRSPTDCTRQADVVEEIARIYGFDRIEERPYAAPIHFQPFSSEVKTQRTTEDYLIGAARFQQVETYPWIDSKRSERGVVSFDNTISMVNPLSPEQNNLKPTMIRGLAEVVAKNIPFSDSITICDYGTTRESSRNNPEQTTLGLAARAKDATVWQEDSYLVLKGHIEQLLRDLGCDKASYTLTTNTYFHPNKQALIGCDDTPIGSIQVIHPYYAEKWKLTEVGEIVVAELDMAAITSLQTDSSDQDSYETIQDQIVRRDMNFVLDRDQSYDQTVNAIAGIEGIAGIEPFDLYGGEHLPADKKSIGIRIKIVGDGSRQTEQINGVMQQAIDAVVATGASLRE